MESAELDELARRARSGDGEALGKLLLAFREDVLGWVRRKLGTELGLMVDDSEVLQSTMRQAIVGFAKVEYRGEATFRSWLCRLAARRIASLRRRSKTRKRDMGRERPLHAVTDSSMDPVGDIAQKGDGPATRVRDAERVLIVRECVERLEEPLRSVLIHEMDGKTSREISLILAKPDSTIRTLQARARKQLAPILRQRFGGSVG